MSAGIKKKWRNLNLFLFDFLKNGVGGSVKHKIKKVWPNLELKFAQNWLDHIENSLQAAYRENKNIVVMGDVSIDLWKSHPLDTKWLDICSNFGFVHYH